MLSRPITKVMRVGDDFVYRIEQDGVKISFVLDEDTFNQLRRAEELASRGSEEQEALRLAVH